MPRRRHSEAGELNRALEIALAHGDLKMTLAAARDLPVVGLERATQILLLMARERSPLYRKAAARWLSRFASEINDVTPTELADAAEALARMQDANPDAAEQLLASLKRPP